MKRILMFATYPISNPQHGGQKRVRALYDAYINNKEFDVRFCAIYFPLHYSDSWNDDIALPKKYSSLMTQNPLIGDVITGRLVNTDNTLINKIKNLINDFNPEIIEIEHPFLYIGIKNILEALGYKGKLIYSSHNIEYSMKKEMLENENYDSSDLSKIVQEIKDAELSLSIKADLIFTVSDIDTSALINLGIKKAKIILARNGIDRKPVNDEDKKYWKKHFSKDGISKIALFVGSAHPPNWTGFGNMIGSSVGFLRKDERIVLAGSIGDYFKNNYKFTDTMSEIVFWKRVISVGKLSENKLSALIDIADCLILPIVEGGGSNLKTAEALLSEKPIVGTTHAFRAFEGFLNYPIINISDNPKVFREMVAKCIRSDKPILSKDQSDQLREVTWDCCLINAIKEVSTL